LKKWYKEPLFHFLIIGAMIFILFSIVNKEEDTGAGNKIVVTAAEIQRFSDRFSVSVITGQKNGTARPRRPSLRDLLIHTLRRKSITAKHWRWDLIRMTRFSGAG
jgi:hypothetical protein